MHELSITQNIVDLALEYAQREKGEKILSVTLEIGQLSGVIPDAVEFAFDVCTKGTMAQGAELKIRHIPAIGHCLNCGLDSGLTMLTHVCPKCGDLSLETIQGQEMKFIEMEID